MPQAIPQPQARQGKRTDDDNFVVFEHVGVFDAHEGEDGVVYDEQLLRQIASNCNERIQDTGDFVPVVVAHTKDEDEKIHVNDDPPVIGLAGPFYVGTLGKKNPRPCIFTTFWIWPEHEETLRDNPRRSVEIWPEERPEDRYFDPIAVLGGETPKRDLGLIYSRRRSRRKPHRYAMPGPLRYSKRSIGKPRRYQKVNQDTDKEVRGILEEKNNRADTIRDLIGKGQFDEDTMQEVVGMLQSDIRSNNTLLDLLGIDREQYAKQPSADVSPSKAKEILEHGEVNGKPLTEAQRKMFGAAAGKKKDAKKYQEGDPGPTAPGGGNTFIPGHEPKKRKYQEGDMPLSQDELQQIVEALKPTIEGLVNEATVAVDSTEPSEIEMEDGGIDDMDEEDQLYAKGLGRKMMKYMGKYEPDEEGADVFMGSLDDEDRGFVDKYMKYMCDDSDAKDRYSQRYAKSPIGGEDISPESGGMSEEEMKSGKPQQYSRIKSERDQAVQRYAKLNSEHQQLKQKYAKQEKELSGLRTKERYAKRYAVLKDREMEGYCLDVDEEMEMVEDMSDEQFDRHANVVIPQRYSKVSGDVIPIGREEQPRFATETKDQKYARTAADAVQKYRKAGKQVGYKQVLDHLIENDGQINEGELLGTIYQGNGKH